jgi:hypothetical protein
MSSEYQAWAGLNGYKEAVTKKPELRALKQWPNTLCKPEKWRPAFSSQIRGFPFKNQVF